MILFVIPFGLWVGLIAPYAQGLERTAIIKSSSLDSLARYRAILSRREELAKLDRAFANGAQSVKAGVTLTVAELQSFLREAERHSGARLRRMTQIPEKVREGLIYSGFSVEAQATFQDALLFLQAISRSQDSIGIERASFEVRRSARREPDDQILMRLMIVTFKPHKPQS